MAFVLPAAWECKLEAYHQYLVEHPETLLARHQQDGPNASGVWILDRGFGW